MNSTASHAYEKDIKINVGCAARPLSGYVNIDLDDLETIKKRYPNLSFPEDAKVYQYDVFNLPFEDGTVAEVRADSFIEHMGFQEEPRFFLEMKRVIRKGGILRLSVPDFEKTVEQWLKAKDDWKDFFRNDPEAISKEHWFGNYSYSTDNRWGYLTASIFGPQNGEGQFHKNAYTKGKLRAILERIGFKEVSITESRWKGNRDFMIDLVAEKL